MALLTTDVQVGITTGTSTGAVKTLYETMYFLLETTLATAGTLDVEVEWSSDGLTWVSFSTPDVFTQVVATGEEWLATVPARAAFFRLNYTVTTGPFDFTISAIGF